MPPVLPTELRIFLKELLPRRVAIAEPHGCPMGNDVEDAARAGGIRTRVSTSSPHTLRPSSGIGIRAATPRSVRTLLSYGTRWRAASPMRAQRLLEETTTLPWCWIYFLLVMRFSLLFRRRIGADGTSLVRGTGLEPALRGSQPLVPIRLHYPLLTPTVTPSERFELPTPSFVARCSRSTELRRQCCGSLGERPSCTR